MVRIVKVSSLTTAFLDDDDDDDDDDTKRERTTERRRPVKGKGEGRRHRRRRRANVRVCVLNETKRPAVVVFTSLHRLHSAALNYHLINHKLI
jgi:hypothetical protein